MTGRWSAATAARLPVATIWAELLNVFFKMHRLNWLEALVVQTPCIEAPLDALAINFPKNLSEVR